MSGSDAGMALDRRQKAGLLLFAGAAEFAIGMTAAQAMYPGYNISHEFLGDLGVGPTALLFNASIAILGLTFIAAAWLLSRRVQNRQLAIAVALAGIGALGFGLIPATEDELYVQIHTIAALLAYGGGALSAILAFRILRSPLRYVSVALGGISLVALGLLMTKIYVLLDRGGMERAIIWPVLVWGMAAGGSLLTMPSAASKGSVGAGSRTE